MASVDVKALGEMLRAIRGDRSQPDVARESGVPQYIISNLEQGKVQKPSFEDLTRLAGAYGITPNDIAALAGLIPPPDESEDATQIPEVERAIQHIRALAYQLDPEERRYFSGLLMGTVNAERIRNQDRAGSDEASLPGWLRRSLRSKSV